MLRDFYVNRFFLSGVVCRDVEVIDSEEGIVSILYIREDSKLCSCHQIYSFRSIAKFVCENVRSGCNAFVYGHMRSSGWYDSSKLSNYTVTLIAENIEIF